MDEVKGERRFMKVDVPGVFEGMVGEVKVTGWVDGYGMVYQLHFNVAPKYLEGDVEDKNYGFGAHELSPVFITPEEYDSIPSWWNLGDAEEGGDGAGQG